MAFEGDRPRTMTGEELAGVLEQMLAAVRTGSSAGGRIEYMAQNGGYMVHALWQVGDVGVLRVAEL